ncbi:MAG: RhuM protein [Bacteroidaceae bacterium]
MRRIIKTDENGNIHITGNSRKDIWMTAWEIAELFNVTVASIQKEIRTLRKSGILTDYEVCKYIRMENGYSADIFNLDIIIAVAYRVNTFYTHAFRKWLREKAVSGNEQEHKSIFILFDKSRLC